MTELQKLAARGLWAITENGCWEWTGTINLDGYGVHRWNGRQVKAHRLVYEMFCDEDISGVIVHHKCKNIRCVNPKHLEAMPADRHGRITNSKTSPSTVRRKRQAGFKFSERANLEPCGMCQCGCGTKAPLAPQTDRRLGWIAGRPLRYVRGHNNIGRGPLYTIDEITGCWIWARFKDHLGYGKVAYRRNGKQTSTQAHRWMYECHNGTVPASLDIHHLCHNPSCVNPDHLEAVSTAVNVQCGLVAHLTTDQVREARERAETGSSMRQLALFYGVSSKTISNAVKRITWRNV